MKGFFDHQTNILLKFYFLGAFSLKSYENLIALFLKTNVKTVKLNR